MKLMKILNLSFLALVAVVAVSCGKSDDQQQQNGQPAFQQQYPYGQYPNGQYPGGGNCSQMPGTTLQPNGECRINCQSLGARINFNAYANTCEGWSTAAVNSPYFYCMDYSYPNNQPDYQHYARCYYTYGAPQGGQYYGVGGWYNLGR